MVRERERKKCVKIKNPQWKKWKIKDKRKWKTAQHTAHGPIQHVRTLLPMTGKNRIQYIAFTHFTKTDSFRTATLQQQNKNRKQQQQHQQLLAHLRSTAYNKICTYQPIAPTCIPTNVSDTYTVYIISCVEKLRRKKKINRNWIG